MRHGFSLLVLALPIFGCSGGKDDVALSARIENAELEVRQGALGDQLIGGFDLVLTVGDYAAESTEVSLGGFSVLRGETSVLVDRLELRSDPPFPRQVAVGGSETVRLEIDEAAPLLESEDSMAVCEGSVWLRGVVTDTLGGGKPTTASSLVFDPVCP